MERSFEIADPNHGVQILHADLQNGWTVPEAYNPMSEPAILYVPGIKPKPPAAEHRAALWRCLLAGVKRVDQATAEDMANHAACFQVVSWAHEFYDSQRDIALDLPGIERILTLNGPEERDLREASSWSRKFRRYLYLLVDAFPPLIALVGDSNIRASVADTRRYFANENDVAVRVRYIVADALLDTWKAHRRVLVIGHSLGSVIAFDVLWELSHRFAVPGKVDLFLSIGSPLGLSFVRDRLLGAHESGRRRYPTNIRHWINLAATGEMTALDRSIADDWAEMRNLGLVSSISDDMQLQTYFRGADGLNLHKCYGYMINPVVAGKVAAWWRSDSSLI
jgi:hypothetical protein